MTTKPLESLDKSNKVVQGAVYILYYLLYNFYIKSIPLFLFANSRGDFCMKPRIFLVFVLILTLLSGCKRSEPNVKEYSKEGRWEIFNFKGKAFFLDCDNSNVIIRGKKS